MLARNKGISLRRLADLLAFDLIAALFLTWYVMDNHRRWPALLVLVPLLLLINFALGRRALGARRTTSYALPAVYACGLIYGIGWAVASFTWWKLVLLVVPITLLLISVRRSIKERNATGIEE